MAKESLDSDRVNFLIWRYLVDSGYRETAARLEKEWNAPDPQRLACAPHVPKHALVGLLNRGLLYSIIEQDDAQVNVNVGGDQAVTGFFGPLAPPSAAAPAAAADEEDPENSRKRQIANEQAQISNGPPVKRPRLSNGNANANGVGNGIGGVNGGVNGSGNVNGYENGYDASAMDLDDDPNGDEQAYPSPEQLPSPIVATVGPEQGTQIDKVSELSTETMFLELSDDPAVSSTSPSTSTSVLLQCEWNPEDPKILAAAGTDALARMWTLSLSRTAADADPAAQSQPPLPMLQPHTNLLDSSALPSTTVSGLAWASDGHTLAIASEPVEEGTAKTQFYVRSSGRTIAEYNTFESPIVCLRWNPSNDACLALSPEGRDTLITVMYPGQGRDVRFVIHNHSLHDQTLEAAWTSNEEFVLSGGDILQAFHCLGDAITPTRKFETREGHALSKVTFDHHTNILATASDTGSIDLWDGQGQCYSFNAHQGLITSLIWQPITVDSNNTVPEYQRSLMANERLLASAGEDGAISIWNARSPETKLRCSMTMGLAVVALAFTPDGAFIAGATTERIFIWKVDEPTIPRATWSRGDQLGWRTPQSQDSTTDENQYSLSWNSEGKKLAYGVSTSLAVINFQR